MACLVTMDSKKFIKDFLSDYDPKDFQFVLVSENITTIKKHKNVMPVNKLIPPPAIMAEHLNGNTKEFKKKYFDYLKKNEVNSIVSILIKAVLNGWNVIMLCSKSESEYGYLDVLAEFIEKKYKMKVHSAKSFMKDPKKAMKLKNKNEVLEIFTKTVKKFHEDGGVNASPEIDVAKFLKDLKNMGKKDLYKYCKAKGFKVDKDMDKSDLIKVVKKKIA